MLVRHVSAFAACLGFISCQAAAVRLDGFGGQQVLSDIEAEPQEPISIGDVPHTTRPTNGFVAFGDSYSAGIGTGVDGKENDCRQGFHAYPWLVYQDLSSFQGENSTDFQWLSCTGATTEDLLSGGKSSQIDDFNTTMSADFATLSIGGNDLGFFEVINACIFRFYSYYSGTCEAALEASEEKINSTEFEHRLQILVTEILDKVQWEKHPQFTITLTGYAKFFNAETPECDDMSLGVWWGGPKLKKEVREKMNNLVLSVNGKLRNTVSIINALFMTDKLVFVDFDKEFEGHRFCEPNVTEPDYNRTDTWFFLVGGPDNAPGQPNLNDTIPPNPDDPGTGPVPPTTLYASELLGPDSDLIDPERCLERAQESGDWGELALCYMAMAKSRDPTLQLASGEVFAENSMWYVPTYYGKVFHPRSLGHKVVRDKVYDAWNRQNPS